MTIADLITILNTEENRAAYDKATDKAIFVQDLIEEQDVETYPGSPLCDFVENAISVC